MVTNLDNTLPQTKAGQQEGALARQELANIAVKVWRV